MVKTKLVYLNLLLRIEKLISKMQITFAAETEELANQTYNPKHQSKQLDVKVVPLKDY